MSLGHSSHGCKHKLLEKKLRDKIWEWPGVKARLLGYTQTAVLHHDSRFPVLLLVTDFCCKHTPVTMKVTHKDSFSFGEGGGGGGRGNYLPPPPPPQEILILDLLLDALWWNLGLFSNIIYHLCVIIIDSHAK